MVPRVWAGTGKCVLQEVQGHSGLENKSSGDKYLQANEAGLPAFTPTTSPAVLSAGVCRVARAEVVTFFQSENSEDPTWATPGEMLRALGDRELKNTLAAAMAASAPGHKEDHSLRLYTRKRALIPACWCSPTLHSTRQIPACEGHISTVPKTPGQERRAEQRRITGCNGMPPCQALCKHRARPFQTHSPSLLSPPRGLALPNGNGHEAPAVGLCMVPALRLTGIKVVDPHAILPAGPDAEQLPVKVDGVDILSAAHVQEVPSDPLLLSHHQPRQCVAHVAVDGWERQRSGADQGFRIFPSQYRLWDGKGKGKGPHRGRNDFS